MNKTEIAMPNSRYINETAGRSPKGQILLVLLETL